MQEFLEERRLLEEEKLAKETAKIDAKVAIVKSWNPLFDTLKKLKESLSGSFASQSLDFYTGIPENFVKLHKCADIFDQLREYINCAKTLEYPIKDLISAENILKQILKNPQNNLEKLKPIEDLASYIQNQVIDVFWNFQYFQIDNPHLISEPLSTLQTLNSSVKNENKHPLMLLLEENKTTEFMEEIQQTKEVEKTIYTRSETGYDTGEYIHTASTVLFKKPVYPIQKCGQMLLTEAVKRRQTNVVRFLLTYKQIELSNEYYGQNDLSHKEIRLNQAGRIEILNAFCTMSAIHFNKNLMNSDPFKNFLFIPSMEMGFLLFLKFIDDIVAKPRDYQRSFVSQILSKMQIFFATNSERMKAIGKHFFNKLISNIQEPEQKNRLFLVLFEHYPQLIMPLMRNEKNSSLTATMKLTYNKAYLFYSSHHFDSLNQRLCQDLNNLLVKVKDKSWSFYQNDRINTLQKACDKVKNLPNSHPIIKFSNILNILSCVENNIKEDVKNSVFVFKSKTQISVHNMMESAAASNLLVNQLCAIKYPDKETSELHVAKLSDQMIKEEFKKAYLFFRFKLFKMALENTALTKDCQNNIWGFFRPAFADNFNPDENQNIESSDFYLSQLK